MIKTKKGTELQMLDLRGKSYLPVAQRVLWFREEHIAGEIETHIVKSDADYALLRASIRDGAGNLLATAHQDCWAKDFGDHISKAETSAIGRALALAGFGTAFAEELDEEGRISDAPIERKQFKDQVNASPKDRGSDALPKKEVDHKEPSAGAAGVFTASGISTEKKSSLTLSPWTGTTIPTSQTAGAILQEPIEQRPIIPKVFETYDQAFAFKVPFQGIYYGKALGDLDNRSIEKLCQFCETQTNKTQGMVDLLAAANYILEYNKK